MLPTPMLPTPMRGTSILPPPVVGDLSTANQIGLAIQHSRVPVHFLHDVVDSQLFSIQLHLFAIFC